jgi:voltage-gated potassium channel
MSMQWAMSACDAIAEKPVRAIWALPHVLWHMVRTAFADAAFQGLSGFAVLLIALGSAFYWRVEKWSYVDAVYFSVVTLTTVGYGDMAPQTDAGKLFTVGYILIGLGVIAAFISSVASTGIDAWSHRSGEMRPNRLRHDRPADDDRSGAA